MDELTQSGAVGVFVLFPMPEPFDMTVPLKQSLMRIKVHSQPSKLYTCSIVKVLNHRNTKKLISI